MVGLFIQYVQKKKKLIWLLLPSFMLVQFLVQDQIFLQACFSEKHLIILYALQYNLSSFS